MKFRIVPGGAQPFVVEAKSFQDAATIAVPQFKSRVFGIECDGRAPRFFLVRGSTPFPISARVAALELGMGGGR